MATVQNVFLRKVRESWKREFPFFEPVDINEVPKLPKGTKFVCGDHFESRKVVYFIHFDFSEKRAGEFSICVSISASKDRSVLEPPNVYKPSPLNVGSYGIGAFLDCQTFRWTLVDVDAGLDENLRSLGLEPIGFASMPSPNTWKPSSFSLPAEKIVEEAILDVNEKLKSHVFPRLQIDYRKLTEQFAQASKS